MDTDAMRAEIQQVRDELAALDRRLATLMSQLGAERREVRPDWIYRRGPASWE